MIIVKHVSYLSVFAVFIVVIQMSTESRILVLLPLNKMNFNRFLFFCSFSLSRLAFEFRALLHFIISIALPLLLQHGAYRISDDDEEEEEESSCIAHQTTK